MDGFFSGVGGGNAGVGDYYTDDGLGGLAGIAPTSSVAPPVDDGLGGLVTAMPSADVTGYAPAAVDEGYPLVPFDEADPLVPLPDDKVGTAPQSQQQQLQQQQDQMQHLDSGLGSALDEALFGSTAAHPVRQGPAAAAAARRSAAAAAAAPPGGADASSDDDMSTEDGGPDDPHGTSGVDGAGRPDNEPDAPLDAAALEAQHQNAWFKECFDAMSEAQRNRLEAFTRSSLQKKTMKKVLTELTGGALNDRLVMAIASVTKMHVGEIVENARQIAARQGHTGALLPRHIRAAYAALDADGRLPQPRGSQRRRLHLR